VPVYHGFRGQEQAGIRMTKGLFASEGEGVYIALDKGLAKEFAGSGKYSQELEFRLDRPLVIRTEPLYMLLEAEEVEQPVQGSDSDWLKANKLAYQMAMKKANNNWSEASELVGQFLTRALRDMGYDGVMVDQGKDNRWAVVFDPGNVEVLGVKRHAHVSREIRLAQALICSRGVNI
jgi:hypothetical protein